MVDCTAWLIVHLTSASAWCELPEGKGGLARRSPLALLYCRTLYSYRPPQQYIPSAPDRIFDLHATVALLMRVRCLLQHCRPPLISQSFSARVAIMQSARAGPTRAASAQSIHSRDWRTLFCKGSNTVMKRTACPFPRLPRLAICLWRDAALIAASMLSSCNVSPTDSRPRQCAQMRLSCSMDLHLIVRNSGRRGALGSIAGVATCGRSTRRFPIHSVEDPLAPLFHGPSVTLISQALRQLSIAKGISALQLHLPAGQECTSASGLRLAPR